eukprot:2718483-Amphidinium_carterae.2
MVFAWRATIGKVLPWVILPVWGLDSGTRPSVWALTRNFRWGNIVALCPSHVETSVRCVQFVLWVLPSCFYMQPLVAVWRSRFGGSDWSYLQRTSLHTGQNVIQCSSCLLAVWVRFCVVLHAYWDWNQNNGTKVSQPFFEVTVRWNRNNRTKIFAAIFRSHGSMVHVVGVPLRRHGSMVHVVGVPLRIDAAEKRPPPPPSFTDWDTAS